MHVLVFASFIPPAFNEHLLASPHLCPSLPLKLSSSPTSLKEALSDSLRLTKNYPLLNYNTHLMLG